jgi:WD40 repeat protein
LAVLAGAPEAFGTTLDRSPPPALLLKGAARFLVQDGWDSVALYDAANGQALRRFPAGARVNKIDLTADEKFLLIACADGGLSVWDVMSGENVWRKRPAGTGLDYVYDASFAYDGKSFVVCNSQDFALVGDTATGQQIGVVRFPAGQTNIMSACLSPDCNRGVLVTLGEEVFTFDARTGVKSDTGVGGAGPVRYSSDGRFAAFRSSKRGSGEHLRVAEVAGPPSARDLALLGVIGHIKPTSDGAFLVTAAEEDPDTDSWYPLGVRCLPGTGEVKKVWKLKGGEPMKRMDFDPGTLRGVCTDYMLVTRLFDLTTGEVLLTADNSANFQPAYVTVSGRGGGAGAGENEGPPASQYTWPWPCLAASFGAVVFIALLAVVLRRRGKA